MYLIFTLLTLTILKLKLLYRSRNKIQMPIQERQHRRYCGKVTWTNQDWVYGKTFVSDTPQLFSGHVQCLLNLGWGRAGGGENILWSLTPYLSDWIFSPCCIFAILAYVYNDMFTPSSFLFSLIFIPGTKTFSFAHSFRFFPNKGIYEYATVPTLRSTDLLADATLVGVHKIQYCT